MEDKSVLQITGDDARRQAKTLIRTARHGALATIDPQTGAPQVTRVGVSTDFDGAPVLLISASPPISVRLRLTRGARC